MFDSDSEKFSLLKKYRCVLVFVTQLCVVAGSLLLAYAVRFDFSIPAPFMSGMLKLLLPALILKMIVFVFFGLFSGWWRYVSMADLINLVKANLVASMVVILYAVIVHRLEHIPRSVLLLDGVLCFLLMGGIRFLTRAFRENYFPLTQSSKAARTRVVLVGAGDAGQMIAREIRQNPTLDLEIVGFIDDDPHKRKQSFQGYPVLGSQDELESICKSNSIEEVVIAAPSASGKQIKSIVDNCLNANVKFKTLPGVGELIDGRVTVQNIKEVEVEDLLGRDPVRLDLEKIRAYLAGKRVLITGAGGSIGSELSRQIANFHPAKLVLFDNAESPLFHIERELSSTHSDLHVSAVIGDVRSQSRVEGVFDESLPEVVFHAAAYKHVPMMERNPAAAAMNNVFGTKVLADTAAQFGVLHFVMISTDKAVNPTNIMGATKRAAELYVQNLGRDSRTKYVTVRFGNVLGSNGSVIPIFKEQIKHGGPLTVTHSEVTRFFMTIPEAAQLVLQAGSMGKGGEIFLLDMGEPIKILDLAEQLIKLSGLKPYEDIEIEFTGLRPGEKLFEELLLAGEGVKPTTHEKICVANSMTIDGQKLLNQLDHLKSATRAMDLEDVRRLLKEIVPEFKGQSTARETAKIIQHPASVSVGSK